MLHPQLSRTWLNAVHICAILVGCVHPARGSSPEYFCARTWRSDDGLLDSTVSRVIQDRRGYIWLATGDGLTRFDGWEFKTFDLPPQFAKSGDNIRAFVEEKGPSMLVLPPGGNVLRFNEGSFSLHPISACLQGKSPEDLSLEPDGTIWVGSPEDRMLLRWKNGQAVFFGAADGLDIRPPAFFTFAIDEEGRTWIAGGSFLGFYQEGRLTRFGQTLGNMLTVAPARSGGIWLLADGQLLQLQNGRLVALTTDPPQLPADTFIRHLFEDSTGALWIAAGRRGLYRFAEGKLDKIALAYDDVIFATEDRESNIWVGNRGGGLSVLRRKLLSIYDTEAGLPLKISSSVCEDPAGNIWFANGSGGICRKSGDRSQTVIGNVNANSICPDRHGDVWVGTTDGLYLMPSNLSLPLQKSPAPGWDVRIVFGTSDGDVWIAGRTGGLGVLREGHFQPFSAQEGYAGKRITAISEDPHGQIWVASESGTLGQFIDKRLVNVAMKESLPAFVHAIHVDSAGSIWIGTRRGLLLRQGDRFTRFTKADGLPDDIIMQIQEDNLGNLWFGGHRGYFLVGKDQLHALAEGRTSRIDAMLLGPEDGLTGISPVHGAQPSAWKDRNGVLWFTTNCGIIAIDPALLPIRPAPPPVYIQEVLIDGRTVAASRELGITSGNHRVEFRFAALSYSAPNRVRLRHQLEGVDPEWVDTGITRSASYSHLMPGTYRMRVAAGNGDGTEATLALVVTPRLWQTLWFRAISVLSMIGSIAWIVHRWSQRHQRRKLERLEQENALGRERTRIARDLHDELGSSLSRLTLLVDRLHRRMPEPEFRTVLDQLTLRLRRHSSDLQRVVWTVNPNNNTLECLNAFIGRFAQNFFQGSPIICQIHSAPEIPPRPITPDIQHHFMAIAKESFNNVFKHSKASEVLVETALKDGIFEIRVRDNGIGFNPATRVDSEHNGLRNMQSRAAEIGGELTIRSKPGEGTEVRICMPVETAIKKTPS
jgi:signal transduction histidine kinase/ligand-binding sensor domain-containing protein